MKRAVRSAWLLLAVLCCLATTALALGLPALIDKYLVGLYKQRNFSGVVLVADEGRVIYSRAYGMADYGHHRPVKLDTLFNLASVAKQFTAMGIMLLKEKELLAYDD